MSVAGVSADSPAAEAVLTRVATLDMNQAAEDAVLTPVEIGAWSHELRAAFAARIAQLNGDDALSERYAARAGDIAALADPEAKLAIPELDHVIAFMDKVAGQTRQVEAGDITALQEAKISDADIVRLVELNAFVSHQVRVIAGLRLLNRSDR